VDDWVVTPQSGKAVEINALLKVYPDDRAGAWRFLQGFKVHLGEA
jgi:hypothetical protein